MFVKVLMTTCQVKYTEDGKNISIKIKIYPQYSMFSASCYKYRIPLLLLLYLSCYYLIFVLFHMFQLCEKNISHGS